MLDWLLCRLNRKRVPRRDREAITELVRTRSDIRHGILSMWRESPSRVRVITGETVHPLAGEGCDLTISKEGGCWIVKEVDYYEA